MKAPIPPCALRIMSAIPIGFNAIFCDGKIAIRPKSEGPASLGHETTVSNKIKYVTDFYERDKVNINFVDKQKKPSALKKRKYLKIKQKIKRK